MRINTSRQSQGIGGRVVAPLQKGQYLAMWVTLLVGDPVHGRSKLGTEEGTSGSLIAILALMIGMEEHTINVEAV